jgi:xylulokinase
LFDPPTSAEHVTSGRGRGLLLGIDLGTSGVKALLLSADGGITGSLVGDATAGYPLATPRPGWSEQDPAAWWDGVCRAVRLVLEKTGAEAGDVEGVALSGQMHGATLLDGQGEVLRPCILWNDQRSGAECELITTQLGLPSLLEWVGNPALAGFTAPKIVWVRTHEPDVYRRIATILLPKDYVNLRLTGSAATEVSDASGTLLFDVARRQWSKDMLNALEIPRTFLPEVHESNDIVGRVTPAAARATGLRPGTPVVAGGADNACAAVGLGVVGPGQVLTSIGTSGTIVAPTARAERDPEARLHTFCHAVPDTWYLMGVVLSAGGSLRWFRDVLGTEEQRQAEAESRDAYEILMEAAATAPPGSEGLMFLPYLTGERSPHGDPDARGAFVGLSLRHGRGHMVRSVLEGVTFALRDSADIMRMLGVDLMTVRATGGGARSALWRRIQANVLDTRVVTVSPDAGPALGAAVLAGVGVGMWSSIPEAIDLLIEPAEVIDPDAQTVPLYERYHSLYDQLYPALAGHFRATAGLVAQGHGGDAHTG